MRPSLYGGRNLPSLVEIRLSEVGIKNLSATPVFPMATSLISRLCLVHGSSMSKDEKKISYLARTQNHLIV